MILKIFKAVWIVSVLAVLANLLFVYAGLPEQVVVQEEGSGKVLANREFLFYALTAILLLINVLVYAFRQVYPSDENLRAWFHGLVITINGFFIIALNLVQVYNSTERFNFSEVGYIIYASVFLMVGWAVSWPLYSLTRKFRTKQAIL